jgi:septal ring factor EnvC (AmiA/AmiB activator)
MLQDDDLVPEPNLKGYLDLTNRAWVNLDPAVWNFAVSLVVLDISYNHIHEIPPQIGQLVLLKELHASFNKISSIPAELGRLKRLRIIKLNSNRLMKVPSELGKLEQLEELNLSENLLESLPNSLSLCPVLRLLHLQNNNLREIPHELADILTLEDISVENNPALEMVPHRWQGDSSSVLFICKVHREYHARMEELATTNGDLVKHSQYLEQEQMLMKENVDDMRHQIEELKKAIPKSVAAKMDRDAAAKAESELDLGEEKKSSCSIL